MLRVEGLVVELDGWRLEAEFTVPEGAVAAVIGPSGGGKSTLLATVAGFVEPVAGRIAWGGRDLAGLGPAERPVTLLFQEHNLFPHLTAGENVGLGLRPDLRLGRGDGERVEAALAAVGLAGLGARRPAALSGGQRQRVALARALLRERPVLMLDEPFAALGPALRREMLELVARLQRQSGATVLMVTHAPEDARAIASHAVVVAEGRAGPAVPTDRLFAAPPPELRAYLGG